MMAGLKTEQTVSLDSGDQKIFSPFSSDYSSASSYRDATTKAGPPVFASNNPDLLQLIVNYSHSKEFSYVFLTLSQ